MHKIFYIDEPCVRNEFLRIAIHEHLGRLKTRNKSNYLPIQVEHVQPINDLPDDIIIHDPVAQLEAFEADYMIITPRRNAKIISQQLRQINVFQGSRKRTMLDYTKQFNILKRDPPKSIIQRIKDFDLDFEENPFYEQVLTSIRVPPSFIDEIADKKGITANLSHTDSDLQVKTAFKKEFKD